MSPLKTLYQGLRYKIVQYNAALGITGAIKGTSRKKLCQELGLEYLQQRKWMKRLCLFKLLNCLPFHTQRNWCPICLKACNP